MPSLRAIMMIDDSESDNYFHQRVLRKMGLGDKTFVFTHAQAALDQLGEGSIEDVSLIFLDINMPGMNGFEFLEAYQEAGFAERDNVIVVMLSCSLNPADRMKAESFACVKEFFTKPLTKTAIDGLVDSYFS